MLAEFKPGQAYQHLERAQHLERQGRLDEAMMEFKRAVEADPSIAAARNALGQHYLRKGLLTKAVDEFHSAALLSGDYESCFNLGRVLVELERYAEAKDAFGRCLTLDPGDPSSRYELAYVQFAAGQFGEALAQFLSLVEQYPEDWELKFAIADCQMGLEDYAAAEQTLRGALHDAPSTADLTVMREAWLRTRRYLEFPTSPGNNLKNRLYADHGIILLGTGHDDGLDIPIYKEHTFTYRDVGVTLCRLWRTIQAGSWHLTAVTSVDEDSLPLAIALSHMLEVPLLSVEELRSEDFVLLVLARGDRPELFEVTLEHIPGRMLSFALALTWSASEGLLSDVVGVRATGTCTLPWHRLRKRSAEAAATSIFRALTIVPDDDNAAEQARYYTQDHQLLRCLDPPRDGREMAAAA